MTRHEQYSTWIQLGHVLTQFSRDQRTPSISGSTGDSFNQILEDACRLAEMHNRWFTREHILHALESIGESLQEVKLREWLNRYPGSEPSPKTVGVVMAGNIPAVGFHDFVSTLLAGHRFLGKLSSDDQFLIPALSKILQTLEPRFTQLIHFTHDTLKGFDAVIATGSNNTSRYFEYYFGKYPHIFRKNRNGIAILTGHESKEELSKLSDDVFLYFGKGCRSISKIYLPRNYHFGELHEAFEKYHHFIHIHKYKNNYDYNKAILQLGSIPYIDLGFVLLKEETLFTSPVSILHYEYYEDLNDLKATLSHQLDQIQCIVRQDSVAIGGITPGCAQHPELWDYADGVDTMDFLLHL